MKDRIEIKEWKIDPVKIMVRILPVFVTFIAAFGELQIGYWLSKGNISFILKSIILQLMSNNQNHQTKTEKLEASSLKLVGTGPLFFKVFR